MLTRALYLAVIWFAISLFATLSGGFRLRRGNTFLSAFGLAIVLAIGDAIALFSFGIANEILWVSAAAFLFGMIWIMWLRDWNAYGQVTWAMTVLATIVFILYSFM